MIDEKHRSRLVEFVEQVDHPKETPRLRFGLAKAGLHGAFVASMGLCAATAVMADPPADNSSRDRAAYFADDSDLLDEAEDMDLGERAVPQPVPRNFQRITPRIAQQDVPPPNDVPKKDAALPGPQSPPANPKKKSPAELEIEDLKALEDKLQPVTDDELRHDQNRAVLKKARPLAPGENKTGLLRRATQIFSAHKDFEDAHSAAAELNPDDYERAKSLVLIADAERMVGQVRQAWWSLHEAQQIALKLSDSEQALTVFRQIGEVEKNLDGGAELNPSADDLVNATINHGLPNPGYEEVEILRQGGGPLREPQVLRHTYYYNGDRKFQGPMLRGGPTIVRVTHPRNGCVCDVCLNLPRGTPTIKYTNDDIIYCYPDVEVVLHFYNSGKYGVRFCQFDAKLHRWVKHLTPHTPESGSWFFGGETNAIKNAAQLAAGPVLNVGSRLPITSGLIRPEAKRIPNTLTNPKKISMFDIFHRSAVK